MPGNEATYTAPTARIDLGAKVGPGTRIGEYCVIEPDVTIGANCVLEPYVYLKRWTTLGDGTRFRQAPFWAPIRSTKRSAASAAICG